MSNFEIYINDLRLMAKIGWSEEERAFPQRIECSLKVRFIADKVTNSDELSDTIDYDQIVKMINEITRESEFRLLESLGGRIRVSVLKKFKDQGIKEVEVSLSKFVSEQYRGVTVVVR